MEPVCPTLQLPSSPRATPPPTVVVEDNDLVGLDPFQEASSHSAPRSNFLAPPSAMSADEDVGEGSSAPSAAAPSPFNFQTQVISTAPVKSVRAQHILSSEPLSLTHRHRTLDSAAAIGTSIVAYRHSIKSSRNRLPDHRPFYPHRYPSRQSEKPGRVCKRTSAPDFTGAYVTLLWLHTSSSNLKVLWLLWPCRTLSSLTREVQLSALLSMC